MHNSGSAAKPLTYGRPIRLEDARMVMEAAEAEARRNGWPMVIAIVDSGGHLVMLHRCDDAQLGSLAVARLKAGLHDAVTLDREASYARELERFVESWASDEHRAALAAVRARKRT